MSNIIINKLFNSGVHIGHRRSLCNPMMKKYIFNNINKINIIDIKKTVNLIKLVSINLDSFLQDKKKILFICTKKKINNYIKNIAMLLKQFYVCEKWIGGLLTNWECIKKTILNLNELELNYSLNNILTKKELFYKKRKILKLKKIIGGIQNMNDVPDAIFVIDAKKEQKAILEANRLGIKVFAIVDTDSCFNNIDYIIPGNDDSYKSIKTIFQILLNKNYD